MLYYPCTFKQGYIYFFIQKIFIEFLLGVTKVAKHLKLMKEFECSLFKRVTVGMQEQGEAGKGVEQ